MPRCRACLGPGRATRSAVSRATTTSNSAAIISFPERRRQCRDLRRVGRTSCGVTFTFGGLRITTEGEVLNTDYQPIRGLYAAGELVGGLFYFNYPGGSGLTSGAVFGRIAGASAARAGKN